MLEFIHRTLHRVHSAPIHNAAWNLFVHCLYVHVYATSEMWLHGMDNLIHARENKQRTIEWVWLKFEAKQIRSDWNNWRSNILCCKWTMCVVYTECGRAVFLIDLCLGLLSIRVQYTQKDISKGIGLPASVSSSLLFVIAFRWRFSSWKMIKRDNWVLPLRAVRNHFSGNEMLSDVKIYICICLFSSSEWMR